MADGQGLRGVLEAEGFILFHLRNGPSRPRFIYVSPGAERVTGYPRQALQACPRLALRAIWAEDRRLVFAALRRGVGNLRVRIAGSKDWEGVLNMAFTVQRGPCQGRDVLGLARPYVGPEGAWKPQGRSSDAPFHLLVAGFVHDLGNLFVPILGNADLASRAMPQHDPVQENLKKILAAAHKAVEYIKSLENLISQRAAPEAPRDRGLDLGSDALERFVRSARQILPSGIELELCHSVQGLRGCRVFCDVTELDRVLMNLCLNAAQAMNGRGRIRVSFSYGKAVPGDAVLNFCREGGGGYARFSVEDDGPGLPDGSLHRLFDPFVSARSGGKGLGLDVVRRFVAAVGGAVAVRTAAGKGTRFDVFVPASQGRGYAGSPEGEETGGIVLVDDDEAVLEITGEILKEAGWHVLGFSRGEDAVRFFQRERSPRPRLLITDVCLDALSGVEVVQEARRRYPELPVVVATGDPNSPRCRELVRAVPDAVVLRKPWRRSELFDLIHRLTGVGGSGASP